MFNFLRIAVAAVVLIVALVIVHKWLPAGRRPLLTSRPASSSRWCCGCSRANCSAIIWREFAYTYVTYYAGLASAMIALVFLYVIASIFIYGGELNAAILRWREQDAGRRPLPRRIVSRAPRSRPRSSSAPAAAR